MTIARMWECRLAPGATADFVAYLATVGWPRITAAAGFEGGEIYRSPDPTGADAASAQEERAVVVTRWVDDAAAAVALDVERELAQFCARDPHAWQFEQVEIGPAEEVPRH